MTSQDSGSNRWLTNQFTKYAVPAPSSTSTYTTPTHSTQSPSTSTIVVASAVPTVLLLVTMIAWLLWRRHTRNAKYYSKDETWAVNVFSSTQPSLERARRDAIAISSLIASASKPYLTTNVPTIPQFTDRCRRLLQTATLPQLTIRYRLFRNLEISILGTISVCLL